MKVGQKVRMLNNEETCVRFKKGEEAECVELRGDGNHIFSNQKNCYVMLYPREYELIEPNQLPEGCEWQIYRQVLPTGLVESNLVPFKDFDEKIYHSKIGDFHLFNLKRNQIDIWAFCMVTVKNVL